MSSRMELKKTHRSSLARRNIQKFARNKLAIFGLLLFLVVTLMCIFAPLITKESPTFINTKLRYLVPGPGHPLGCDQNGRDVFARILYGGRISIAIGLLSAILTNILGVIVGCVSGFFGNRTDKILMYVTEIFACIPDTLLILVVMGFAGQSVFFMILIFVLTGWTGTMRMVRSRILSLKTEPFVESCTANGISKLSIMFRHLLPNTLGIVIIQMTSSVASYVLSEAALSFLGLGVPKIVPTWGNMLNAARSLNVMQNYPILWIAPGIAISLFVLGVNFFGDGLRDVFDVKQE